MAVDPAARPADAGEVARALRPALRTGRRRWAAAVAAAAVAGLFAGAMADRAGSDAAPRAAETALPDDPFDRGRAHLDQGEQQLALECFTRAYRTRKDGRTAAHLSYTLGLVDQSRAAADMAAEAIRLGYDTPAVRNNRAYCLVKASRTNTDAAVADLTEALRMDPKLRAARYNMATTLFWRDFDQDQYRLKDLACVQYMDDVMRDGPTTGQLYFDAARVYAVAARQDPALFTRPWSASGKRWPGARSDRSGRTPSSAKPSGASRSFPPA